MTLTTDMAEETTTVEIVCSDLSTEGKNNFGKLLFNIYVIKRIKCYINIMNKNQINLKCFKYTYFLSAAMSGGSLS